MSIEQVEKLILEKWKITIQCHQMHNIGEEEIAVNGFIQIQKSNFFHKVVLKYM